MIDNYDSFTYNLVQYFQALGQQVEVRRNNEIDVDGIRALSPSHLVISPGPCSPNEAGVSLSAITSLQHELPILGVCLGHQSIGQVFGASVVRARRVMHGKTSMIRHSAQGVFQGLNDPLQVTRYHSLLLERQSLPECLEITAWSETEDGSVDEIMGIRHRSLPIQGVQFHPESILSEQGQQLLQNFLTYL